MKMKRWLAFLFVLSAVWLLETGASFPQTLNCFVKNPPVLKSGQP